MLKTNVELNQIAALAYINLNDNTAKSLAQDVTAIMNFVEQLREVDTTDVEASTHGDFLHQRLRDDVVIEQDKVNQLEQIAPLFIDGLYLVPKVIESGN